MPTFEWEGAEAALTRLAERAESVRTVQAECGILLRRQDGYVVTLDGAIVAAAPGVGEEQGSVRVRAWKLGRAVFDATTTPEGLWVFAHEETGGADAGLTAERLAEAWGFLAGKMFAERDALEVRDAGGSRFVVVRGSGAAGGARMIARVDRATLAVRSYEFLDASGALRQRVDLSRYRMIDGIAWPMRVVAEGDAGRVVVTMRDVEFNGELAPGAFRPPARAVRRP